MIKTYDSISALRSEAIQKGIDQNHNVSWYGGETLEDSLRMSEIGDLKLVPEAERQVSELETQIEVPRRIWERNVAGAYPCVPDYLSGLPTPMRHLQETQDEHAPITILVCSTSSASIKAEILMKRGTTILALVLALSRIRPVSLWTVATLAAERGDRNETVLSARIETAPLDLATACYVLTSAGWARRITYSLATKLNGFVSGWPRKFNHFNQEAYMQYLAQTLSQDPLRTLVIKPTYLTDPLITNSINWLNEQIHRFTSNEDES